MILLIHREAVEKNPEKYPLNSNMILLIHLSRRSLMITEETLNSNLILLIPVFKDTFKTTGYNTYFCRPQK